jgi:hypothetical protein
MHYISWPSVCGSWLKARWRIIVGGAGTAVFLISPGVAGGFVALLGFGMLLLAVLRGRSFRPGLVITSVALAVAFVSLSQPWLSIGTASRLCTAYCSYAYGGFQRGLGSIPDGIAAAACLLLLVIVLRAMRGSERSGTDSNPGSIMVVLSAALAAIMIWQLVDFEQDYAWWVHKAASAGPSMSGGALFGPLGALAALAASLTYWLRGRRRKKAHDLNRKDQGDRRSPCRAC